MNKKLLIGAALLFGAGVYYITKKPAPSATSTGKKAIPNGISKGTSSGINQVKSATTTIGGQQVTFKDGDKVTYGGTKVWTIDFFINNEQVMLSAGISKMTAHISQLKKA